MTAQVLIVAILGFRVGGVGGVWNMVNSRSNGAGCEIQTREEQLETQPVHLDNTTNNVSIRVFVVQWLVTRERKMISQSMLLLAGERSQKDPLKE